MGGVQTQVSTLIGIKNGLLRLNYTTEPEAHQWHPHTCNWTSRQASSLYSAPSPSYLSIHFIVKHSAQVLTFIRVNNLSHGLHIYSLRSEKYMVLTYLAVSFFSVVHTSIRSSKLSFPRMFAILLPPLTMLHGNIESSLHCQHSLNQHCIVTSYIYYAINP